MASWLNNAIFYEIYPQSFNDSNGDGIGDFQGIIDKLQYVRDLGCNAIWINPCFDSSFYDAGYDVRDYYTAAERYGSNADLQRLFERAHELGMHVLLDLVPGHSAVDNPWFLESGKDERNAWTDRYIWRPMTQSPNLNSPYESIRGFLGGIAERPDAAAVNCFSTQACLNYGFGTVTEDWQFAADSPEAVQGRLLIQDIMDFWLGLGADGFRVDVAHGLAKDLDRDDLESYKVCEHVLPSDGSHPLYDRDEVHDIYREWRKVFNEYNPPAFAVAEAWVNPDRQHLYASTEELGQVFNFEFAKKDWIRDDMHLAIEEGLESAERSGSSATWVMSNHDVPRHASRYGLPQVPASSHHQLAKDWLLRDGTTYEENRELGAKRARAAILMELALPGSTYIYQGEELGLPEVADIPWNKLEDPTAFNSVREQIEKGRDGCRVPLPWVAADAPKLDDPDDEFGHDGSFGFSPAGAEHDPHLPQPKWYKDFAVDVEDADPNSMLNLYRKALSLRHNLMPQDTELQWLDEDRPSDVRDGADGQRGGVIAYSRSNGWASVTNFGERPAELPQGDVILASGELTEDGRLPQDTTVWLQL